MSDEEKDDVCADCSDGNCTRSEDEVAKCRAVLRQTEQYTDEELDEEDDDEFNDEYGDEEPLTDSERVTGWSDGFTKHGTIAHDTPDLISKLTIGDWSMCLNTKTGKYFIRNDKAKWNMPWVFDNPLTVGEMSKWIEPKAGLMGDEYSNTYLVAINEGGGGLYRGNEEFPQKIRCWVEWCDKAMIVCGYPFYICDNNHHINVKTGEKGLWIPTDGIYHGLLEILERVEDKYQAKFHPTSLKRSQREADEVSSYLSEVGEILYDELEVKEEDTFNWGKDELQHNAGLRFAMNVMENCLKKEYKFVEVTRDNPQDGFREIYIKQAKLFKETTPKETLMSWLINTPRVTILKQATLF